MFSQARSWQLPSEAELSALDRLGISPRKKKNPATRPKDFTSNAEDGGHENKRELREHMTTHVDAKANDDIQLNCAVRSSGLDVQREQTVDPSSQSRRLQSCLSFSSAGSNLQQFVFMTYCLTFKELL